MYLEKCLDSALQQQESFDEIIIIDDGSDDGSELVCGQYARMHKEIKLIVQRNQGAAIARNNGIKSSKSQYVCFLDSDDYIKSDYVKKIKEQLRKESVNILYFEAEILDEIGTLRNNVYDRSIYAPLSIVDGSTLLEKYYKCFTESPCMAVYDKAYLERQNIIFPPIGMCEDNLFTLRSINEAESIFYLKEKIYVRRYRKNSVMTATLTYDRWRYLCSAKEMCFKYVDTYLENCSKAYANTMVSYLVGSIKSIQWRKNTVAGSSKNIVEKDYSYIQKVMVAPLNKAIQKIDYDTLSFSATKLVLAFMLSADAVSDDLNEVLCGCAGIANRCWAKYRKKLMEVFVQLPLNKQKRVGIYGIGDHTKRMLRWYEYFYDIACELLFIDSFVNTGEKTYLGFPVINVNDIDKYEIDEVIISSVLYEKDMNMKLTKGYQGVIHRFYDSERDDLFIPTCDKPLKLCIKKWGDL